MKQIDIPPVVRSEKDFRTVGSIFVPSKRHFTDQLYTENVRFLRCLSVTEGSGIDYLNVFVVNADDVSQIASVVQQAARIECDREERACLISHAKSLDNAWTVTSPLAGLYLKTPDGQTEGLYFQKILNFEGPEV
jgi:hypothetical protein